MALVYYMTMIAFSTFLIFRSSLSDFVFHLMYIMLNLSGCCSLKPITFLSRSNKIWHGASFHPLDGHGDGILSLISLV